LKKPSRNWDADYGSGVDDFAGVCDACGDSDGDSVAVGVADGAAVAVTVGDDSGDARDALEGRDLEIWMSDSRKRATGITTPTATAHFVQYRIVEPCRIV
jgi:hypothetical protein